jgi:hypothetical protein
MCYLHCVYVTGTLLFDQHHLAKRALAQHLQHVKVRKTDVTRSRNTVVSVRWGEYKCNVKSQHGFDGCYRHIEVNGIRVL